jgi:hypothetical protein
MYRSRALWAIIDKFSVGCVVTASATVSGFNGRSLTTKPSTIDVIEDAALRAWWDANSHGLSAKVSVDPRE